MNLALAVLLLCIWSGGSKGNFTEAEFDITLLLVSHFHGSFCIYITKNSFYNFWSTHVNSDKINFFWSISTLSQLQQQILNPERMEKRSGRFIVVLKANEDNFFGLKQISQTMSLSSAVWVMYSDKPMNAKDFQGIYIPFDCEFIFVNSRENIHGLTEIYQIDNNSDIETSNFGYWTKDGGIFIHEELFYKRRKGLKGRIFPAVIGNVPPYVLISEKAVERQEYGGYFYEVWKEIQHRIYFGVEFQHKNLFNISAIFGLERIEFAVWPIEYDSSTLDQMDITHPIYESRTYLFGHRPGSELQWNSYLKPFDAQTWWASLGWMASSSVALTILYKIAWDFGTSEKEAGYFIFSFRESVATVFRAMCMQGSDVTPRSNSCRLLFLSIYLTALVVSSAFSAALFSLLTIPTTRAPFNDFEEVIMNKAYRIGLLPESNIYGMLQEYTSKYPHSIQSKLLEKMEGPPKTILDGLNAICQNKHYIMIDELPYVLHNMQNMTLDCQEKVMPAGPVLLKTYVGFGLKKGSPYKELIDLHLLIMRNEGIIKRLLLNNWPPQIPSVQATWVRVTLADISPILYMFSLGAAIATVLLIVERIKHFIYKHNTFENKDVMKRNLATSRIFSPLSTSALKIDQEKEKNETQLAKISERTFWR